MKIELFPRWVRAALAVVLLMGGAVVAPAQRHGNHNAQAGSTPTGAPDDRSQDLRDFSRAVALQATPEQAASFKDLRKSVTGALKCLSDLRAGACSAKELSDAADESRMDSERFLSGFTEAQQSGMKAQFKRARKADQDIGKEVKTLDKSSTVAPANVDRLEKALRELQDELQAMGKEMGIGDDGGGG